MSKRNVTVEDQELEVITLDVKQVTSSGEAYDLLKALLKEYGINDGEIKSIKPGKIYPINYNSQNVYVEVSAQLDPEEHPIKKDQKKWRIRGDRLSDEGGTGIVYDTERTYRLTDNDELIIKEKQEIKHPKVLKERRYKNEGTEDEVENTREVGKKAYLSGKYGFFTNKALGTTLDKIYFQRGTPFPELLAFVKACTQELYNVHKISGKSHSDLSQLNNIFYDLNTKQATIVDFENLGFEYDQDKAKRTDIYDLSVILMDKVGYYLSGEEGEKLKKIIQSMNQVQYKKDGDGNIGKFLDDINEMENNTFKPPL